MPRKYPDEFRHRAVALVRAGQSVTKTASDLGITDTCLYGWVGQDRIDRGEIPGTTTVESRELRKARRRIRELDGATALVLETDVSSEKAARGAVERCAHQPVRREKRRAEHDSDRPPTTSGCQPTSATALDKA